MQHQTTTKNKPESITSPPLSRGILQRKCACGNQAAGGGECGECGKKKQFLQRRAVHISEPGDRYEQEADRIADEVMRMPEPTAKHQVGSEKEGVVQRKAIADSITSLQSSSAAQNQVSEVPPIVDEVLRSAGQPLDTHTRAFMESRFGYDFSGVRVHTDAQSAESALAVNAIAYTMGRDVVFGAGQYTPQTTSGKQLLGHELTHVVQQGYALQSLPEPLKVNLKQETTDTEVKQAASSISTEEQTKVSRQIAGQLQRKFLNNDDPIHQPIIDKFRADQGFPKGGVDEFGQQVGPSDAEIKYQSPSCQYSITYSNPKELDCTTIWKNTHNGNLPPEPLCGKGLVYDITSVSASGTGCPAKLDGLMLSETVQPNNGCVPKNYVFPAPKPCLIGQGGKLNGCTDTYALCGPTRNLQGTGCTEIVTQQLLVGGQVAESHYITFKLDKTDQGCTGTVSRK